jgi:AcrR family transcriptional regulator
MTHARTERGEARRREVVNAALPLFLERGVAGVTLEEIRRGSGASIGSIYHLFGGKEAIAAAVYVESLTAYQREFVETLEAHEGAEEGIRSVVRFHIEWCRAHPDRARFLFALREPEVLVAAREQMEQENRVFYAAVQSWWRAHAHHGALRRMTREQSYALWIGPAMELVRTWLTRGGEPPSAEDTEVLAAAAWRALGNGDGSP